MGNLNNLKTRFIFCSVLLFEYLNCILDIKITKSIEIDSIVNPKKIFNHLINQQYIIIQILVFKILSFHFLSLNCLDEKIS